MHMKYKKEWIYGFFILFITILMILFVDVPLANIIKTNINQKTINIFSKLTVFGSFSYIVLMNVAILLYLLIKQNKEKTRFMLAAIVSQSLTAIIIQILKFIFGRARPFYFLQNNLTSSFTFLNFQSNFVSFPSGHSAGMWALITCLLIIFKDNKYSKLLIIPAFIISLSRLILNVHFLSDVFIGSILGIVLAKFFYAKILNIKLKK